AVVGQGGRQFVGLAGNNGGVVDGVNILRNIGVDDDAKGDATDVAKGEVADIDAAGCAGGRAVGAIRALCAVGGGEDGIGGDDIDNERIEGKARPFVAIDQRIGKNVAGADLRLVGGFDNDEVDGGDAHVEVEVATTTEEEAGIGSS